jgi:hypothetical protein
MQPHRLLGLLQLLLRHSHLAPSLKKTLMSLSQVLLRLTFLVIMLRSKLLLARQTHYLTLRIQLSLLKHLEVLHIILLKPPIYSARSFICIVLLVRT